MAMERFDYVTVGHVTVDVLERDGGSAERRPGGGAFYSALQAARLGLRTLIVTQGVAAEIEPLLEPYRDELALRIVPASATTTMLTRGFGEARRQHLLAWAGAMQPPAPLEAEILHLAPVARETPAAAPGSAAFLALTPQGLVRRWDDLGGELLTAPLMAERVPERFDAVALSCREAQGCAPLIAGARARGAVVAVTAGPEPTTVRSAGIDARVPAFPVSNVADDLGAGDVFAAALFAALHGGADPLRAATFANAAAALRIAGDGPQAIGARPAIEALTAAPPGP